MLHIYTISCNDAGQRLDKYLMKLMPSCPKGMLYKLIRKKDIRLNNKRCKGDEQLCEGDTVRIFAPDDVVSRPKKAYTFQNAQGKPDVLYEDANILIAYKPSGMYAHGGENGAISLLDEIQKYLYDKGEYQPDAAQTFAPALCNRIDRNTEGLVISAKNAAALRSMNEIIRKRLVQKVYLAVVSAPLPQAHDVCTAYLRKDERRRQSEIRSSAPDSTWKEIITEYEVLARNGKRQLVKVTLHTGRTHQIRAHLAYLGAPLLGDPKYSRDLSDEENQCLCAWALRFEGLQDTPLSALDGMEIKTAVPEFVRRLFPEVRL